MPVTIHIYTITVCLQDLISQVCNLCFANICILQSFVKLTLRADQCGISEVKLRGTTRTKCTVSLDSSALYTWQSSVSNVKADTCSSCQWQYTIPWLLLQCIIVTLTTLPQHYNNEKLCAFTWVPGIKFCFSVCTQWCLQCFDTVGWAAGRASGL